MSQSSASSYNYFRPALTAHHDSRTSAATRAAVRFPNVRESAIETSLYEPIPESRGCVGATGTAASLAYSQVSTKILCAVQVLRHTRVYIVQGIKLWDCFFISHLPARGGNFRGYCQGCMGIKINTTRDSGKKMVKIVLYGQFFLKWIPNKFFILSCCCITRRQVIQINMLQGYF